MHLLFSSFLLICSYLVLSSCNQTDSTSDTTTVRRSTEASGTSETKTAVGTGGTNTASGTSGTNTTPGTGGTHTTSGTGGTNTASGTSGTNTGQAHTSEITSHPRNATTADGHTTVTTHGPNTTHGGTSAAPGTSEKNTGHTSEITNPPRSATTADGHTTMTTHGPTITHTPKPRSSTSKYTKQKFDVASFFGGLLLALGVVAIVFVAYQCYEKRKATNYTRLAT